MEHGTTWPANPHTLAKIAILKGYLKAYFPILGRAKRGQTVLLVDGFAGPGEYSNADEGSPVAALRIATASVSATGSAWAAGDITCAFIEPDKDRCDHLRKRLQNVTLHQKVKTMVLQKTFVDGIEELKRVMPRPFTSADPLFVFIDPFGATGVPFKTVASILGTACSEVLINLDSDGIARNLPVPGMKDFVQRSSLMTSVFGDASWQNEIISSDFKVQCQQVLELYKTKLRSIHAVEYVFSFEMRGIDDMLNYHLVFASQNPLGLEKMKEAMRAIDQTGSYSFSDGQIHQSMMFRFDHPEDYASKVHQQFSGREVLYPEIAKFTLNETPFINPIRVLRVLDERSQIDVVRFDDRTKGFSNDHVRTVKFLNQPPRQSAVPPKTREGFLFGD